MVFNFVYMVSARYISTRRFLAVLDQKFPAALFGGHGLSRFDHKLVQDNLVFRLPQAVSDDQLMIWREMAEEDREGSAAQPWDPTPTPMHNLIKPPQEGPAAMHDSSADAAYVAPRGRRSIRDSKKHLLKEKSGELSEDNWKELIAPLPTPLRANLEFGQMYRNRACWTCTPDESLAPEAVLLTIAGAPVVIPVKYSIPLRDPVAPPPDPHPRTIFPCSALDSASIVAIMEQFEDAIGFYLLLNGFLQLIVLPGFDYESAYSHQPAWFGGLKVCYIEDGSGAIPTMPAKRKPQALNGEVDHRIRIGSSIQARLRGQGSSSHFMGKIGLKTRYRDESYLTMSTHVITRALSAWKFPLSIKAAGSRIHIFSTDPSVQLGMVDETFDPQAKKFPLGFKYDVSLVKVTNEAAVSDFQAPMPLEWLSHEDWMNLKYRTQPLFFLEDFEASERSAKSIGLSCTKYQIVGQGILFNRPKPSKFLRGFTKTPDESEELTQWTDLVVRSLLYRVSPDFPTSGGQSGMAVCVNQDQGVPKVAGFQSFVQESGWTQTFTYDIEGEDLYTRLHKGRVAFYGAFQVPPELRETHEIC